LLDHGADPHTQKPGRPTTALDYLIGCYGRSPEMAECIDILLEAGGSTRYDLPGVLAIIQNRTGLLEEALRSNPALVDRRFPELDCGSSGARRLLLQGATLLHVAAEFGCVEAAALLLERGADVNARATVDEAGVGGQTPIFHAVAQFRDWGLGVTRLLLDRGADLSVRARLPGHYDRPDEVVECTPLGYAVRFPGEELPNEKTLILLRERGARE
jgi:ankyrin repeat protein